MNLPNSPLGARGSFPNSPLGARGSFPNSPSGARGSSYLIFSVIIVIAAKMIPTIQKRITILDSGKACKGR